MSENQPMDPTEHDSEETGARADDRRQGVNPAEGPVPRSPDPDEEAVRKGEEILERIKPY